VPSLGDGYCFASRRREEREEEEGGGGVGKLSSAATSSGSNLSVGLYTGLSVVVNGTTVPAGSGGCCGGCGGGGCGGGFCRVWTSCLAFSSARRSSIAVVMAVGSRQTRIQPSEAMDTRRRQSEENKAPVTCS
jgi:hypothetical protein